MSVYSINYDLHRPGQEYDELYEAIKDLGAWWHCLESVWLVDTSSSATDIRDELKQYLDSNDEILVIRLSGSWASRGLSDECSDWLYDRL
ncbi:hypothetical protein ACFQS4_20430 [Saliphagus sp. GCM10025317]